MWLVAAGHNVGGRCGSFRVTSSSSSPSSPRSSPVANPRHCWPPGMRPGSPACLGPDRPRRDRCRHSNKTLWLLPRSVIDRVETVPTICSWLPTTILPAALPSPTASATAASIASVFIRAHGPWWRVIARPAWTPSNPSHCQRRPPHDCATLIEAIRTNDTTGHQHTHTQTERNRQTDRDGGRGTQRDRRTEYDRYKGIIVSCNQCGPGLCNVELQVSPLCQTSISFLADQRQDRNKWSPRLATYIR